MRLLLDTHVLVWALGDPDRLSAKARAAILDERNELFASHVSYWELALKSHAPPAAFPGVDVLEEALRRVGVRQHLPIALTHILGTTTLPAIHRDPFDRLLISQALSESLTLVSRDTLVHQYPISLLW